MTYCLTADSGERNRSKYGTAGAEEVCRPGVLPAVNEQFRLGIGANERSVVLVNT